MSENDACPEVETRPEVHTVAGFGVDSLPAFGDIALPVIGVGTMPGLVLLAEIGVMVGFGVMVEIGAMNQTDRWQPEYLLTEFLAMNAET